MKDNKGFSYIDVLVSIALMFICFTIIIQISQFNYNVQDKSSDINNITIVAQGVMDVYRELGKAQALNYGQGYTIDITEDAGTGHTGLKKVTITVTPKASGISSISLVSYHT